MTDISTVLLGDNLTGLRCLPDECVDLCYLDPPFNTGRKFGDFDDRWQSRGGADDAEEDPLFAVVERGHSVAMANYLRFMQPRIREMRRVLAPHGTLYLHCDPTSSHYLKVLLDTEFGADNYLNDVVCSYRRWPSKMRNFQRMHDNILRYAKGGAVTWSQPYEPMSETTLKRSGRKRKVDKLGPDGKMVRTYPGEESKGMPMRSVWEMPVLNSQSKERRCDVTWNQQYEPSSDITTKRTGGKQLERVDTKKGTQTKRLSSKDSSGMPLRSVWDLSVLSSQSKEAVKYDTQKPLALLRRIIEASSNPGDVVLDPFCGSGTTLVAAKELGRQYIGFDQNPEAIAKTMARLAAVGPRLIAP